jgi:hypothetical protein
VRDEPHLVGARFVLKKGSDIVEVLAATALTHAMPRTNRESRNTALETLIRLNTKDDLIPALYFNEDLDTLWLTNYTLLRACEDF